MNVCRMETQMTTNIQAILQMLQRQCTLGPPAYSTLASSPEYDKQAIRVQPVTAGYSQVRLYYLMILLDYSYIQMFTAVAWWFHNWTCDKQLAGLIQK